ncbi:MAG: hypothetical protein JXP73_01455 [Deltaproteobacteria bacterium]|nr:hypothetical protein [Deltaproteobacteria bacterium]
MIESEEIPATLRELIAAEKACPDPQPEVGQRVYARLAAGLGLSPFVGDGAPVAPGPTAPAIPAGSAVAGSVAKVAAHATARGVLTFVVGAAVGATAYGTVQHLRQGPALPAAPTIVVPAPAPVLPLPPPPAPLVQPERAEPAAPSPVRVPRAESGFAAARDRGLAAERKLVEMARSALARGRTDDALAALRRHARAFTKGQLAEERDSLFVQVLVAKGDFTHARKRAAAFYQRYPQSLFSPVVEQALRSMP